MFVYMYVDLMQNGIKSVYHRDILVWKSRGGCFILPPRGNGGLLRIWLLGSGVLLWIIPASIPFDKLGPIQQQSIICSSFLLQGHKSSSDDTK